MIFVFGRVRAQDMCIGEFPLIPLEPACKSGKQNGQLRLGSIAIGPKDYLLLRPRIHCRGNLEFDEQMTVQFNRFDTGARPVRFIPMRYRPGLYRNFFKRLLDTLFILATLPVSLLVIAVFAVLVAADGGKVFYRSPRVGRNGRVFGMVKLRSMVPNANELLEQHFRDKPGARQEWKRTQKLKNDPRVTPIGRVLRKTSLDELPQLWNVLMGDMSLVGPRPMQPDQEALYPGIAYYSLRPGMTGPWQVTSRNESEFCQRSEYDQLYDKELSLFGDIKILFKTIGVVFRGTGY